MTFPWQQQQQQQAQQHAEQHQPAPNFGPAQAPNVQVTIPPVQSVQPINTHGFGTPEQQLAQAAQMVHNPQQPPVAVQPQIYAQVPGAVQQPGAGQMQPGNMNPIPGVNPAVPGQHLSVPQVAPVQPPTYQNVVNPHLQGQAPQIPAAAPAAVEPEYGVALDRFEGVDENILNVLVDDARAAQVPGEQLEGYVAQQLESGIGNFKTGEDLLEYRKKFGQLHTELVTQYGDEGAETALQGILEKIKSTGGDGLLGKFMSDHTMLDPEVVGPFLGNIESPYSKFFKQSHAAPLNTPAGGQGPTVGAGTQSLPEIKGQIAALYHPSNIDKLKTPEGAQAMLDLKVAEKTLTRPAPGY